MLFICGKNVHVFQTQKPCVNRFSLLVLTNYFSLLRTEIMYSLLVDQLLHNNNLVFIFLKETLTA